MHEIRDVDGAKKIEVKEGEIIFNDITFGYSKDRNVFENLNVKINAHQKIGLVGYSGSGKSTFNNLILRLFDVQKGEILIDGQDIKTITQESLHKQIAVIPQEPMLFHRSVMENIRYGKLDATDEEVYEAARLAMAHAFIERLPQGYQSLVGERGVKLSGGQRQRIAIARAVLKNAPILLMDEATSALDSVTEKAIQTILDNLISQKTVLIIAHRLSTISHLERILVFHEGKIVEDGTHHELLEVNGYYAKMWHMQSDGFLPENEQAIKNLDQL
jgi:ATP-binding cassette subfamily B protein